MDCNALIYGRCLELVGTSWNEKLLNWVHLLPPHQKPWFRIELIHVQNNQLRRAGTTNQNRFPHHPLTQRHRAERPTALRSARGRRETISRSLHHCRTKRILTKHVWFFPTSIKTPNPKKCLRFSIDWSRVQPIFASGALPMYFDGHPRTIWVRQGI